MTKDELEQLLKDNPDLRVDGEATRCFQQASGPSAVPASKYRDQRTEHAGKMYPSKHEAEDARRFQSLTGLGKPYKAVIEQVKFRLPKGESHRVDFMLINWENKVEFWESKGKDLESGRIRRHWVEELYNIKIKITGGA